MGPLAEGLAAADTVSCEWYREPPGSKTRSCSSGGERDAPRTSPVCRWDMSGARRPFFPATEIVVINLSTCLSFKDKQTEVQVGERHFPGHRAASRVCQSRVDGLPAVSAGSLNDTRQHQNPKVTLLDLVGDDEVKREGSECLYLNNQMVRQANGRWRTKARESQRCGSWG